MPCFSRFEPDRLAKRLFGTSIGFERPSLASALLPEEIADSEMRMAKVCLISRIIFFERSSSPGRCQCFA